MQLIYAAPFVVLSIFGFSVCLAVSSLRRFAVPALIAPVTFGFASIVSWLASALIAVDVLKLRLGPATGLHGVFEGLFFYLFPGVLVSWFVVLLERFLERRFLRTRFARNLLLRIVISAVAGFLGAIVGFGVAADLLSPGSLVLTLELAFLSAGLNSVLAFFLTLTVQRRLKRKGTRVPVG